jgi:hypothetical protein
MTLPGVLGNLSISLNTLIANVSVRSFNASLCSLTFLPLKQ